MRHKLGLGLIQLAALMSGVVLDFDVFWRRLRMRMRAALHLLVLLSNERIRNQIIKLVLVGDVVKDAAHTMIGRKFEGDVVRVALDLLMSRRSWRTGSCSSSFFTI